MRTKLWLAEDLTQLLIFWDQGEWEKAYVSRLRDWGLERCKLEASSFISW